MRSGVRTLSWVVAAGLLTAMGGCGSDSPNTVPVAPGGQGGKGGSGSGKGGSPGSGGDGSGVGTGGNSGVGTGGNTPSGSGGSSGGSGGATPGSGGSGGTLGGDGPIVETPPSSGPPPGGWMGYPGVEDLTQVKKTPGCGMPPGQALNAWQSYTIDVPIPATRLSKGEGGDGKRVYFVKLPPNYDPNKPYKVVVGGSSCVNSRGPRPIDFSGVTNPSGGVIQVTPETEPGVMAEGAYVCYDDKHTDSIEYPFMEKMLKAVADKFCYDQHKVFIQGHSSGGWLANEMGCVYGSTLLRAMSSNGGGLPQGDGEKPPCKDTPTAGLWILPTGDGEGRNETHLALDRALKVNKCTGGDQPGAWQTAATMPYTAGGAQNCKKYTGCPAAFPVIFCEPSGDHGLVGWHPGAAWEFFNSLP
jgi:poly(3-hydroxybutyrate) depolymerase